MAATVADAALVLDVLTGSPGGNGLVGAALADVSDLRVGVAAAGFTGAEPGVVDAVTAAIEALDGAGCRVDAALRPDLADLELANAAGLVVSRAEAASFHRSLGLDRSRYWEEVREQLAEAESLTALDYLQAQRLRLALAAGLLAGFADHDVLVLPTSPVVAPPADAFAEYLMLLARNAIPFSFVGFPAVSVPCGWSEGLPVGLQVVAAPGREDLVVAVAAAVERLTP
jgi:aspartyl-tRNA(Asn)/glutamyl-tRNA(Gln) amidotransferase subunit A